MFVVYRNSLYLHYMRLGEHGDGKHHGSMVGVLHLRQQYLMNCVLSHWSTRSLFVDASG